MFAVINSFITLGLILWAVTMTLYNLVLFYFYGVILDNLGFFYLGVSTVTAFSLFAYKNNIRK